VSAVIHAYWHEMHLVDVLLVQYLLGRLMVGVARRPAQHADVIGVQDDKAPALVRAAWASNSNS